MDLNPMIKPYPNEHAARIRQPGDFKQDSFKRSSGGDWVLPGSGLITIPSIIDIISGQLDNQTGSERAVQALRFPISTWTAKEAKDWLKVHKIEYISFEAASEKSLHEQIAYKSMKEFSTTDYSYKTDLLDTDSMSKTADIVLNTYLYVDHEQDVLLPGCASKSIQENGPQSNSKKPKIKFCKDHVMTVDSPGRFLLIKEERINNEEKLWARPEFYDDEIGMGLYERYLKGGIDQHSIGFRYMKIMMATREKGEGFEYDSQENWNKWIGKLINPEKAEEKGFFFIVPEIKLFEGSAVSWACNEKTEVLSVKSLEGKKINLLTRMNILQKSLVNSKAEEFNYYANLEIIHIKNEIEKLINTIFEPGIKSTFFNQSEPLKIGTQNGIDYKYLLNHLNL